MRGRKEVLQAVSGLLAAERFIQGERWLGGAGRRGARTGAIEVGSGGGGALGAARGGSEGQLAGLLVGGENRRRGKTDDTAVPLFQ